MTTDKIDNKMHLIFIMYPPYWLYVCRIIQIIQCGAIDALLHVKSLPFRYDLTLKRRGEGSSIAELHDVAIRHDITCNFVA
ncbi:hypothetical protein HMPREF1981_00557 [Bacteroides pyogenes F0041]|uniref:Uncharacterized protein n=1 Tax=Bacteroides pyogenes F0041 TaxID=1321819 RepID=U2E7A6_9BACE|nr:hypothetical protein HMPREF1981_00557 [Bacteroides pyogenes F0041]